MASKLNSGSKSKNPRGKIALQIQFRLQQGIALHQAGELQQARAAYEEILEAYPKNFDCLHLLGVIAFQTGEPLESVRLISEAIKVNPYNAHSHNNLGNALLDINRVQDAIGSYNKAISLKQDYAEAYYNRGDALAISGQTDLAVSSYKKALSINPLYAEAHNNLANTLRDGGLMEEAIKHYQQSISINPRNVEALYNLGNALKDTHKFDEAIVCYQHVLKINPQHAAALNNLGSTKLQQNKPTEALEYYKRSLALNPKHADTLANIAQAYCELKKFPEGLDAYKRAIEIDSSRYSLFGSMVNVKNITCEWSSLHSDLEQIQNLIQDNNMAITPFACFGIFSDPALQKNAAEIYSNLKFQNIQTSTLKINPNPERKIRVGYFSADFHNHATSYLIAELFESHDINKFEVIGFSFGSNTGDPMQQRIRKSLNQWFDVSDKSDLEIAKLSRELGVDIAVDLKGYTYQSRPGIFAHRCAPIQVNFLGYPGTMGANFMDYIIADEVVIPASDRQYFTEKVVYLPGSYQVNDSTRQISNLSITRKEAGLPDDSFVYCCFNNNYKIMPETFEIWMRILHEVKQSVLWLFEGNISAKSNLIQEAKKRGISSERIIFAPLVPIEDHLARLRLADLFIDTLPCNAHTTASDALWAGLPVLTQVGKTFAGRVAASLLNALDLPELITQSQDSFQQSAIRLGNNYCELIQIKEKLHNKKLTSSLFDGKHFARKLECAFEQMHQRALKGLASEHIFVPSDFLEKS